MKFWKMSGAGNDFVMVDNRTGELTEYLTPGRIAHLCRRGLSVGADGLIEILESDEHSFRMRYSNSDGGEAEMCGNGARCICRFALELGLVQPGVPFSFESAAGIHRGLVIDRTSSRIWMTEPLVHWIKGKAELEEGKPGAFVNTGVPHAVVFTHDVNSGDFAKLAPGVRSSSRLGPAGANADWVSVEPDGTLIMRTWERGVEGETLACGTGAVASALAASTIFENVTLPVDIRVKSGRTLTVGRDHHGWWLQGESRIVYTAELAGDE